MTDNYINYLVNKVLRDYIVINKDLKVFHINRIKEKESDVKKCTVAVKIKKEYLQNLAVAVELQKTFSEVYSKKFNNIDNCESNLPKYISKYKDYKFFNYTLDKKTKLIQRILFEYKGINFCIYFFSFNNDSYIDHKIQMFVDFYSYNIFSNIFTKILKYLYKENITKMSNGYFHFKENTEIDGCYIESILPLDILLEKMGYSYSKFRQIETLKDLYNFIFSSSKIKICKNMFVYNSNEKIKEFKILNKFLSMIEKDPNIPFDTKNDNIIIGYRDEDYRHIYPIDIKISNINKINSTIKKSIFELYRMQNRVVNITELGDAFIEYCNYLLSIFEYAKEIFNFYQIRETKKSGLGLSNTEVNYNYTYNYVIPERYKFKINNSVSKIQDVESAKHMFKIKGLFGLEINLNLDLRGCRIIESNLDHPNKTGMEEKILYMWLEYLGLKTKFYINEREMQARLKNATKFVLP